MRQVLTERRQHERFTLPVMYSPVLVTRIRDGAMHSCEGHAYDISAGGLRLELDESLEKGEIVNVELTLPVHLSDEPGTLHFLGRTAWTNDRDDDPGPVRSAIEIVRFYDDGREKLVRMLGSGHLSRAA